MSNDTGGVSALGAQLGGRCTACAGTGEDFNEGDPCNVCGGSGNSLKPGHMAGRSHAMEYMRQQVAHDMEGFYRAFQKATTPN